MAIHIAMQNVGRIVAANEEVFQEEWLDYSYNHDFCRNTLRYWQGCITRDRSAIARGQFRRRSQSCGGIAETTGFARTANHHRVGRNADAESSLGGASSMNKKRIVIASVEANTVTAPDYGDPWVNRLALVTTVMRAMEADELAATLQYLNSKFTLNR